ncbi:MAG: TlpA family protein disulfide reductase [Pseudomonadales bacterium]
MTLDDLHTLWAEQIARTRLAMEVKDADLSALHVQLHNATWCPDCERESTVLLALSQGAAKGFGVLELNSYEDKAAYQSAKADGRLSVDCLPTLIVKREGKEVLRIEEDSQGGLVESVLALSA